MEKDSPDKETSPKKTAAKPVSKAAGGKKTVTPKSGPAKKQAPKKKSAKAKPAAKKTVLRKKKPDIKSLLFKQFDQWIPEKPFSVPEADTRQAEADSPTVSDISQVEADTKKALLFRTFDLSGADEAGLPGEIKTPIPQPPGVESQAQTGAQTVTEPETVDPEAADHPAPPSCETERKPAASPAYHDRPPDMPPSDPIDRVMKFFVAGLVLLILLLIGSSYSNTQQYYIRAANGDLEIWKGSFAPMGQALFIRLPGVVPPPSIKTVYTKSDALALASNHYFTKADGLIEVEGVPDFEKIRSLLSQARHYATTQKQQRLITARLSHIDLMMFIYKAEVAAAKGTIDSFKKALTYLGDADSLHLSEEQIKLLGSKKAFLDKQISDLNAKKKAEAAQVKKAKQGAQKAGAPRLKKPNEEASQKTEKTE